MPCTGIIFQNVKASGWWSWLHLTYFTENVHGTVIDSTPAPKFITREGDGFVSSDTQYVMVQDAVDYIKNLIFGAQGHYSHLIRGSLVPDYGLGFEKAARGFR